MYQSILLAYDGSVEGRVALREGAVIAKKLGSSVFLLSVIPPKVATDANGFVFAAPADSAAILEEGLSKLRQLRLVAVGEVVQGDPTEAIVLHAEKVLADLVVLGHAPRSWWAKFLSEPRPAALIDRLTCSLLIAKTEVSKSTFDALGQSE